MTASRPFLAVDLNVPERVRATFAASAGEVLGVLGPNGSGKSTLVKALAGLVDATGTAFCADRDLLTLPIRERRVGIVFQEGWLFPHLSVVDNVGYAHRIAGLDRRASRAVATEWLERFRVADLADRRPGQLSGGQARRVALARALAHEPNLLLLDEPFTGTDPQVATMLRVELAQHLRDFAGVCLLVTHDPMDALALTDRLLVLEDGRLVQDGPTATVAAAPATGHAARLMGLNVVDDTPGRAAYTFPPTAVLVSLTEPSQVSARHRWRGTVVTLAPWGDVLRLVLRTEVGDLLADLTPASVTELGLVPGREVWVTVKETAVSGGARQQ